MRRRRFAASWRWRLVRLAAVLALMLPAGLASANVSNPNPAISPAPPPGPVLVDPHVYVVYWGSYWTNTADGAVVQYMDYLNDFLGALPAQLGGKNGVGSSPWMGQLAQ